LSKSDVPHREKLAGVSKKKLKLKLKDYRPEKE
jgi:hypothetical protein